MQRSFLLLFCILSFHLLSGQNHAEALEKIKQKAAEHSAVMNTVSYLSDVYGPRMMGTPKYYQSVLWAEKTLKEWGISHTEKQSFDQGHIGWEVEGFKVEMVEPGYSSIKAYPLAFSESIKGKKTVELVLISRWDDLPKLKGKLKGKAVLLKNYYRPVRNQDRPMSRRLDDETLTRARANPDPNDLIIGYHSRRPSSQIFKQAETNRKNRQELLTFCRDEGVTALIEPSDFPYGILHADGNRAIPSYMKENDARPIASFVIANEDFGRLVRLKELGIEPKLKLKYQAKFYKNPEYNMNLIAEIKGSDPNFSDEIVMIGAHLDSWHAGTGAVDNASNCAVMMEAMRLIQQSGLKPKRTIRLALWGGEEQVFAGSSQYVDQKVGDLFTGQAKAEQKKISAYLNLDNGAGKIRGLYLMGNPSVESYFAEFLQPFPQSQTLTLQNANQTDHELFDFQNVPAFQFIQDPLDYMTAIHHTNMDVFEYVPEADQKYNATLIAYLAYRLAQSPEMMPRKQFNSPIPSKEGNVTFSIKGYENAKNVSLVGDFNLWNMFGTPLYKTANGWECKIDLPKGKYYYKFIIDGYWTADPKTPESKLVRDGKGHGGLTVIRVE